jgi:hypothetical protein
MSKYDPLQTFLRDRSSDEVPMTFEEIERILGFKLPEKSQQIRAWWSNNASNNVMTKAWLAAGYRTARVDLAGRRLVFERTECSQPLPEDATRRRTGRKRHPLFGALAGLAKTAPGVDLTEPADRTWGEQVWGEQS